MTTIKTGLMPLVRLLLMLALCLTANRGQAQQLCVFDILGAQGPVYGRLKEFALKAHNWGAPLQLRVYVDERVAAEDFKAGQCDAVLLTGMRARQFNAFSGSIDSIGGLPDYASLKRLLQTLAQPEAATLLSQGNYEVAGILPLGAAYIFIRDRRINSVAKMAGRKIAVLDYDKAQLRMAERIGAQAVASDVTNFAGKFNNGVVDVVAAPGVAYLPLELYKGVGTHGVVLKLPVAQLTFQLLLHKDSFPAGFAQQSRQFLLQDFDSYLAAIKSAEEDILFFFPPPDGDAGKYENMMREARISLTREGIYDRRMMSLMKRVRCREHPANAECSDRQELEP
jgi:hypothetical protein